MVGKDNVMWTQIEKNLKEDILAEASKHGGMLLLQDREVLFYSFRSLSGGWVVRLFSGARR